MKKNFKTLSLAIVVTSVLTTSGVAMAANLSTGSSGAAADTDYTLEEMLTYAIQDEYMAQAEYDAIMNAYGVQRPFSNIIRSEGAHIEYLLPLFETYQVVVPVNDAADHTVLPADITESYSVGVEAEIKNIGMYESFLAEELPSDVEEVFEMLQAASENHLAAFERSVDRGTGTGNGMAGGRGNGGGGKGGMNQLEGNGAGMGNGTGTGIGNGGVAAEDCILD